MKQDKKSSMNIKAFAREIGVSPTTVLRALSGNRPVSANTRDLVLRKMKELGYVPNHNARRLVSGRTYLIALNVLSHGVGHDVLADLFITQLMQGILRITKSRGYDLVPSPTANTPEEHKILERRAKSRAVDGTILSVGFTAPVELIQRLATPDHPCAILSFSVLNTGLENIPNTALVQLDLREGVRQAVRLLADYGHRRIGFVSGVLEDHTIVFFREELEKAGISLDDEMIVIVEKEDIEHGSGALNQLMSRVNPPTAVFACSDILALGILRESRRLGLRVPEDISIIGHDDLPIVTLADPALTAVRIDLAEVAERIADAMFGLLKSPNTVMPVQVASTSLVIRDSAGPVNDHTKGKRA